MKKRGRTLGETLCPEVYGNGCQAPRRKRVDYSKVAFKTSLNRYECNLLDEISAQPGICADQYSPAERRLAMRLVAKGLVEIVPVEGGK